VQFFNHSHDWAEAAAHRVLLHGGVVLYR